MPLMALFKVDCDPTKFASAGSCTTIVRGVADDVCSDTATSCMYIG